jgi:hypothetical protein
MNEFLIANVKHMGNIQESIKEVSGSNMTFKDFIVQHITTYWPVVFREAAVSWPALALWTNSTALLGKIGNDSLEIS